MYYILTEYNTIRVENCRPCQDQENNYYYIMDWDYDSGKYKQIKIKKFSEFVGELVEVGDLLEFSNDFTGKPYVCQITHEEELEEIAWHNVIAIYKKDKRENYLRVWQRKK